MPRQLWGWKATSSSRDHMPEYVCVYLCERTRGWALISVLISQISLTRHQTVWTLKKKPLAAINPPFCHQRPWYASSQWLDFTNCLKILLLCRGTGFFCWYFLHYLADPFWLLCVSSHQTISQKPPGQRCDIKCWATNESEEGGELFPLPCAVNS